jgi:protocatechuate 3,4-dioxygenase beta subunit
MTVGRPSATRPQVANLPHITHLADLNHCLDSSVGKVTARCLLLALACASLHAATIRGTVVEKQSGKPLARALIVVQPVSGSKGATVSARTNPSGIFEFPALAAGSYLVTASKIGFDKVEYGQKSWFSAGTPLMLEESSEASMKLALPHFGAIAGRAIDENNVGIPNCTVLVYRNTRPPEVVSKAVTDDRGAYRISGLSPGTYLARTATLENDTGIYLPTFARESLAVGDALAADAALDQDTLGADVHPIAGRLATVSGRIGNPSSNRVAATVTLVSDMGPQRRNTGEDGRFTYDRVAPGAYELYAQGADLRSGNTLMAYLPVEIDGDRAGLTLDLAPLADVRFTFRDTSGRRVDPAGLPFLVRRRELSGPAKPEYLHLDSAEQARLDPGRWELSLGPNASWYVARFAGPGSHTASGPPAAWNDIVVAPGNATLAVEFVLSPAPATLRGTVTDAGQSVAGAPVYLEAYDPATGSRLSGLRTTRTDIHGQYSFVGLTPGSYRVASTFEYQAPDSAAMGRAGAREIKVEEGNRAVQDLDLWTMP